MEYFRAFGRRCFILNNGKDHLGKFDSKADEGIFLGYNSNSSSYKIFNKRTLFVECSVHVTFDESNLPKAKKDNSPDVDRLIDDFEDLDLIKDDEVVALVEPTIEEDILAEVEDLLKERRWIKHHPSSNIIGNLDQGVTTRERLSFHDNLAFVFQIEPKSITEALQDEY